MSQELDRALDVACTSIQEGVRSWEEGCTGAEIAKVLWTEHGIQATKSAVIGHMYRHGVRQYAAVPQAELAVRRAAARRAAQSSVTLSMHKESVEKRAATAVARVQAPRRELPPVPRAAAPHVG